MTKRLKLDLQMFNEETGAAGGTATPTPNTPAAPTPAAPEGKMFSEDYVKTVRDEAKSYRLVAKAHEASLRTILGMTDGDITPKHVTDYQNSQTKLVTDALSKANERLITAEIKGLEGYDHALVARLVDRSKVTITEDGTITGLTEAVTALAVEFPSIKKSAPGGTGTNPAGGSSPTEIQATEAAYAEAMKGDNLALKISLKNKLHALLKSNS